MSLAKAFTDIGSRLSIPMVNTVIKAMPKTILVFEYFFLFELFSIFFSSILSIPASNI
jgi:hypothetical protein